MGAKVNSIPSKTFKFKYKTLVLRWKDLTIPVEISYPTQTIFFKFPTPWARTTANACGVGVGVGMLKLQLTSVNY